MTDRLITSLEQAGEGLALKVYRHMTNYAEICAARRENIESVRDKAFAALAASTSVVGWEGPRPQEAVPTEQAEPAVVAALQDLLVAVTYAAPARTFAGVLAYEARVPIEFVERADAALGVSRPQPADGCSSNEGAGK
jgi:hypothetical protein